MQRLGSSYSFPGVLICAKLERFILLNKVTDMLTVVKYHFLQECRLLPNSECMCVVPVCLCNRVCVDVYVLGEM